MKSLIKITAMVMAVLAILMVATPGYTRDHRGGGFGHRGFVHHRDFDHDRFGFFIGGGLGGWPYYYDSGPYYDY